MVNRPTPRRVVHAKAEEEEEQSGRSGTPVATVAG